MCFCFCSFLFFFCLAFFLYFLFFPNFAFIFQSSLLSPKVHHHHQSFHHPKRKKNAHNNAFTQHTHGRTHAAHKKERGGTRNAITIYMGQMNNQPAMNECPKCFFLNKTSLFFCFFFFFFFSSCSCSSFSFSCFLLLLPVCVFCEKSPFFSSCTI